MYKNFIKRILDIFFSLICMPFLLIIILIVGILILLDDKGPIFYNAERIGKNGKIFKMYKFRTMKVNSPDIRNKDGSTYNSKEDFRLTKIGKILRETSIDEFPQIINILKGDMSFIGPRPTIKNSDTSNKKIEENKRYQVRPGITGYSQAYFRNSIGQDEKYKYDCYYVDSISFSLDMKILVKTIVSVIKKDNIFVVENVPKEKLYLKDEENNKNVLENIHK